MKHKFSLNSSKFCLSKTFESPYLCHESGELKVSGICGQGCRDKVAVRLASDTQQQDSKLKNYDNCWKRIRLDSYCRPPASHINIPFIRTSEETLATWHPDKLNRCFAQVEKFLISPSSSN
ncbi:unnamed protein product [Caenorhabditis nigoni]